MTASPRRRSGVQHRSRGGEPDFGAVCQLVPGVLEKCVHHRELTVPEVASFPFEVCEQTVGVLHECGEYEFFDLGGLGSVHDAVAHINQGQQVVLYRFRPDESLYPAEGFAQSDRPDFRGNPRTFDAQEADQRADAGVAFQFGQQRGDRRARHAFARCSRAVPASRGTRRWLPT